MGGSKGLLVCFAESMLCVYGEVTSPNPAAPGFLSAKTPRKFPQLPSLFPGRRGAGTMPAKTQKEESPIYLREGGIA